MKDNPKLFAKFCSSHYLVIVGSLNGRNVNQINHFAISWKWRRSPIDVGVQKGADIGSDHQFVVGEIGLKIASIRQTQRDRPRG